MPPIAMLFHQRLSFHRHRTVIAAFANPLNSGKNAPQNFVFMETQRLICAHLLLRDLLERLFGIPPAAVKDIGIAELKRVDGFAILDAEKAVLLAHVK